MNDLYEHQRLALRKLSNGKILWGGVGSGKTLVAATYYMEREAPRHVYVITTAKKRDDFDWQQQFYELGIGPRSGPTEGGIFTSSVHPGAVLSDSIGPRTGLVKDSIPQGDRSKTGGSRTKVGRSPIRAIRLDGPTDVHQQQERSGERRLDVQPDLSGEGIEGDRCGQDPAGGKDVLREGSGSEGDVGRDQLERRGTGSRDKNVQRTNSSGGKKVGTGSGYPYVLTVDSWNNIAKYANVTGAFFIFDEQRLVGSGDWTRKFLRIAKHNRWILLSATPGDTWMDYIPVFVANNFYKNRTAFKREHVVYNTFTKFPKVDRYINVGRLVRQRAQLLVEMPYVRHTKRRHVEVPLPYNKETLDLVLKKRWHVYEDRPLRDVGEMFLVMRKVVNSDPSRLEMVKELWENHPRLIVFYNFNYELESLRSLTRSTTKISSAATTTSSSATNEKPIDKSLYKNVVLSEISNQQLPIASRIGPSNKNANTKLISGETSLPPGSIAEWNGHKHQEIPKTDRWLYLVQYTAGAEGWNCIETDAMIFYSRNYSYKIWEQAQGRIDRLNTPFTDLWYYHFMSDSMIDKAIGRSLKAKETFNEAKYAGLFKG